MKNNMKKVAIAASTALATVIIPFSVGSAVAETVDGNIPINETTFPDEVFREYVAGVWDLDEDGSLSDEERLQVGAVVCNFGDFSWDQIQSLQGIEYAPNLEMITAVGNAISSIDISKNLNLEYLSLDENPITSIDISQNPNLSGLHISRSNLNEINTSQNPDLTFLDVSNTNISSIDVGSNKNLQGLYVSGNQISSINTSQNPELTVLDASDCDLSDLDVSANPLLESLFVADNNLTALDIAANTKLTKINASSNNLNELAVSQAPELVTIQVNGNNIVDLDVTKNPDLFVLEAAGNQLSSLDISENKQLDSLVVNFNNIAALDMTNNEHLRHVNVSTNQLSQLDVSKNTALQTLNASENVLASIDVANNTELLSLELGGNVLETIDVSQNSNLSKLYVDGNNLSSIDVSHNAELNALSVSGMKLEPIDVTQNTKLETLNANGTGNASFDTSKNPSLKQLYVDYNKLPNLDVSSNPELEVLSAMGNELEAVEFANNPELNTINLAGNKLSSLDLYQTPKLQSLNVSENRIRFLDVPQEFATEDGPRGLKELRVDNNELLGLNIVVAPTVFSYGENISYTINHEFDVAQVAPIVKPENITSVQGGVLDGSVIKPDAYPSDVIYTYQTGIGEIALMIKFGEVRPGELQFTDVDETTPHAAEIDWLAKNGISEGYRNEEGTRRFEPMTSVYRQDMAAFLRRVAVKNMDLAAATWEPSDADWERFTDVNEQTPHAEDILWLAHVGISTGYKNADGTFRFEPMTVVYRQDMAAFLHRFATNLGKGEGVEPKDFTDVTDKTPHADHIRWLGGTSIARGYENSDGTYRFEGMTNTYRQDMAAFLNRFDDYVNKDDSR
ncbi:internalin-related protein [Bifidobacterium dolichotidis]|uniref:Internalin-related protein n=1 Tax=Bifidobacterium dolichotidis TaxID=2306976 RepID=A0A430FPG8_9BIFI|nr:S-layer homology domain-containing protein [Bifidobacterium dolichotidis]RSX54721.1 internalin-related protein [Bifidobacterium dolichotidis]